VQQCINDCTACSNSCIDTMSYCLNMGGKHAEPSHISLLFNCAEICRVSADYMLSGSEFSSRICSLCAQVNERCASSCDQFGDDEQMKSCAGLCRKSAESCRKVASM
jgi:hypothetical protein